MQIIPQATPKVAASMEKYGALLEKTWHVPEAADICKQILDIDPDHRLHLQPDNLAAIARLIKDENWIIEPDIPIEDIIKSASLIRKRFAGRYLIRGLSPDSCGGSRLTPELIVEKYEKVRSESQRVELPAAKPEKVWWLSRTASNEVQLITFGEGATNAIRGLQFGIRLSCGDLDTAVSPVVLFDWRAVPAHDSVEQGNEEALRALMRIRDNTLSNPYLGGVHKTAIQALRRLITENRPGRESSNV